MTQNWHGRDFDEQPEEHQEEMRRLERKDDASRHIEGTPELAEHMERASDNSGEKGAS